MAVLKRLCLKFGSHSMSHLLWVGSIDMSHKATTEAWTALRWTTRIGFEELLISILFHSWRSTHACLYVGTFLHKRSDIFLQDTGTVESVHCIICPGYWASREGPSPASDTEVQDIPKTAMGSCLDGQTPPEAAAHLEFNHLCISGKEKNHMEVLLTE